VPLLIKDTKLIVYSVVSVIRLTKPKPISEQKAENIFVVLPYCQAVCCIMFIFLARQFLLIVEVDYL
jgi:hypothetical protein